LFTYKPTTRPGVIAATAWEHDELTEQSSGTQKTDGPAKLQITEIIMKELQKKEHQLGPSLLKPPFHKAEKTGKKHRWDL